MDEIYIHMFRQLVLPRQLLDDDRIRRTREFAYLFGSEIVQRVRSHKQRQVVKLEVLRREMAVCEKSRRDDR